MNYTETHAKIKELENLWSRLYVKAETPARPAEIAAEIVKDIELVEAVAALVKQYCHDPRISRRARQWADKVETCFDRVSGGYVSSGLHAVHISQTAEALDNLQSERDKLEFFGRQVDDFLRSITGAVESVRHGSTTEKGYLLEKIDRLRYLVDRSL